jgi:hypothetical protein
MPLALLSSGLVAELDAPEFFEFFERVPGTPSSGRFPRRGSMF